MDFPKQYTLSQEKCSDNGYAAYVLPEEGNLILNRDIYFTDCTYSTTLGFKIAVPELKAGAFTIHRIRLEGILNPSTGGTGNFIFETRRGDINVLDYNHAFSQVGIAGSPSTMVAATITRTKDKVNEVSSYTFSFAIVNILPKNGYVTIEFNSDSPLTIGSDVTCTGNLFTTPNFTRESEKKIKIQVFFLHFSLFKKIKMDRRLIFI